MPSARRGLSSPPLQAGYSALNLYNEVENDPTIVGMHTRTIGIEDPRHLDLDPALAVIIEEQGFSTPFPLIVAGTRADRVNTPWIFING